MATIVRRESEKGTTYQARIRLRGERPRSRTFKRLTDARKWAAETETELGHGAYVPTAVDRRKTLADLIARYVNDYLPVKHHNSDTRNVKRYLAWWSERFGYVTLDKLKPEVVSAGRAELRKHITRKGTPLTGPSINRYQAALSSVCKYGWRELRWLPGNPVLSVTKAPESGGVIRFLSDDERHRLFEACRNDRNPNIETAVTIALATGLRYTNVRYLRWEDVDLKTGTLTVERTKNGEARRVPLIRAACEALQRHYERDPTGQGWVFKGRSDRAPESLYEAWWRVRASAGLKDFRFHDLRHTTASYLTQSGAGLAQVADALGHKTLVMARRYSHQSAENVRSTLESIADRLGGA